MSSESIFDKKWNDASEGEVSYTRPSVAAALSALFGLATFLVYFSNWFFFLGIIAILLGLYAFWAIRSGEGILTGTTLAYFGLCSAVVALVSVAVFWSAYQYGLRREADQFFRLWFATFQQADMPRDEAYQFIVPRLQEFQHLYPNRSAADSVEEWWQTRYENTFAHRALHQFVGCFDDEPNLIRTLLALGNDATVSYYKTESVVVEGEQDTVTSVYAVTFPTKFGETQTFFVRITGRRSFPRDLADFKTAGWVIVGTPVLYVPD